MQVSGPVQGASTIPRRRRLEVLVAIAAIVVIAAVVSAVVSNSPALRPRSLPLFFSGGCWIRASDSLLVREKRGVSGCCPV
jgi:hypothetical protein